MSAPRRGRPSRFAEYDQLVASLPPAMGKRPKYLNGIGVFRGSRGITAWLKIRLPNGGTLKGKTYPASASVEIKVGSLDSWSWDQLTDKYRELQGKADRGDLLEEAPDPTFAIFATDWLARAESRLRAHDTAHIHVHKHLIPAFGAIPLRRISLADVNRWIARQLKGAAPGTVKRQFNTLRAILNDAVRSGLIEKSPTQNADPIRGAVARQRFLTNEELVGLLAVAETEAEWLPDFILWAVHSGMRKGEVQALTWGDVRDLGPDRVFVEIRSSKSGQPRMVTTTKTMREILARQRGRRVDGDERVFSISKMTLRRRWEAARHKAGLGDVTIHDLRRTHSTHAAISGVDLRTLAARIGHTDLSMLHKHYAAVVGSASEEAAEKIEKAFALPAGG
jgi:integrase